MQFRLLKICYSGRKRTWQFLSSFLSEFLFLMLKFSDFDIISLYCDNLYLSTMIRKLFIYHQIKQNYVWGCHNSCLSLNGSFFSVTLLWFKLTSDRRGGGLNVSNFYGMDPCKCRNLLYMSRLVNHLIQLIFNLKRSSKKLCFGFNLLCKDFLKTFYTLYSLHPRIFIQMVYYENWTRLLGHTI